MEGTSEVTHFSKLCDRHTGEETNKYCHNCKEIICAACSIGEHDLHSSTGVEEAGYLFRGVISANLNRLKKFRDEASEKIQKVANDQKTLDAEKEEAKNAVISRRNEIKEFVDRLAKDLLDRLVSIIQLRSKHLEDAKTKFSQHVTDAESLMLYSSKLISKGTAFEICQNINDLHVRVKDLQKIHTAHDQLLQDLPTTKVVFEAAKFDGDLLNC